MSCFGGSVERVSFHFGVALVKIHSVCHVGLYCKESRDPAGDVILLYIAVISKSSTFPACVYSAVIRSHVRDLGAWKHTAGEPRNNFSMFIFASNYFRGLCTSSQYGKIRHLIRTALQSPSQHLSNKNPAPYHNSSRDTLCVRLENRRSY